MQTHRPFFLQNPSSLCLLTVPLISLSHIQNLNYLCLAAVSHLFLHVITVNTSLPSFLPSFLPPFHLSSEFCQYTKFHLDSGLCRLSRCDPPFVSRDCFVGPGVLRAASWKPTEEVCLCPFWFPLSEGVAVSQKLSVFIFALFFLAFHSFSINVFFKITVRQTWVWVSFCYLLCNLGEFI